jgi:hypothetical protein
MEIGGLRLLVEHGCDLSDWLSNHPRPAVCALIPDGLIDIPCAQADGWPRPAVSPSRATMPGQNSDQAHI